MRTTGLLHTRVFSCRAFVRAPNGIRTRAAALKGRCPRPLDDGGLPRCSRPKRGSRQSIAVPRRAPAEDVAKPHVRPDMTFEHVPGAAAEQHASGRRAIDADHTPGPIQEHDRDRVSHADRMDGPAALEEQPFARSEFARSQPPRPFLALHRHVDGPHVVAWSGQHDLPHRLSLRRRHRPTLATIGDTHVGLAGFEPATRGLKAPCSYQAELQAPGGF
jgi:hypothetical protein